MIKKRIGNVVGGTFLLLVSFALLIVVLYTPLFSDVPTAYVRIAVTMERPPEVIHQTKRPGKWKFNFNEYPGKNFFAGIAYCDNERVAHLTVGDKVRIMLRKEDYRRGVLDEGNYFERFVASSPDVYEMVAEGRNYVSFEKVASSRKNSFPFLILTVLFMGVFLFGGIRLLFRKYD